MASTTSPLPIASMKDSTFSWIPCPIDKIPNEILSRIFLLVEDIWGYAGVDIASPRTSILIIIQVSVRWRSVALSYPCLWSRILLDYNRGRIRRMGPFLKRCLLLSRECPLDITFTGRFSAPTLGESSLKALAESAHKWMAFSTGNVALFEYVEKYNAEPATAYTSLRTLRLTAVSTPVALRPMPNLMELEIGLGTSFNDIDLNKTPIKLPFAPSLKILRLQRVINHTAILPFIPLRQITHLSLNRNTFYDNELHQLLEQMRDLQSFEFGGELYCSSSDSFISRRTGPPFVVLPRVSSFKLLRGYFEDRTDPLDGFSMPQLKHLDLSDNYSSYTALIRFLRRSKCSLETMTIIDLWSTGKEWMDDEFNRLTMLSVQMPACLDYDVQAKTMEVLSDDTIFPQLERIEFMTPEDCMKGFGKKIVWMLKTRLASLSPSRRLRSAKENPADSAVSQLRHVHVKFATQPETNDEKAVKEFLRSGFYDNARRAGVDIVFSYATWKDGPVFY